MTKKSIDVSLEALLEAGAHFGHQAKRWNPKIEPYMFGARGGVHIFDLVKTKECIIEAAEYLQSLQKEKKTVLFVGTKKNAKDKIVEVAKLLEQPYVDERWLGGTLTNFGQIRKSVRRLGELKENLASGVYSGYTKKERLDIERKTLKLERAVGGIASMEKLPDAMVVVDIHREKSAIYEANATGVVTVGIVDSNADPADVTYPIPMNDDATSAIEYVLQVLADGMVKKVQVQAQVQEKKGKAKKGKVKKSKKGGKKSS